MPHEASLLPRFVIVSASGSEIPFPTQDHAISQAILLEAAFEPVKAIRMSDGQVLEGGALRALIGEAPDMTLAPRPLGAPGTRNLVAAEKYRSRKLGILRRHQAIAFRIADDAD